MAWWRKSKEAPTQQAQPTTNSTDQTLRSRIASAVSGGYDYADSLHNVYLDFGYPNTLTFDNFWHMYRRFGIARTVVEMPVETCWMTPPQVTGSSAFESELEVLEERLSLWQRLKGLDTRQRVGRYAGLFMRVRDNLPPDQPIQSTLPGQAALMSVTPMYEGQLTVLSTDTDPMSEGYGLPTMYQYSGGGTGSRNEKEQSSFSIHPSRVVIAAEGADDGGIYGIPSLESSYNSLMDLRKIIGAGGEGFYRNASQSVVFNLKDTASANVNTALLEQFNDKFDEFTKDRMRKGLWTPGLDAKVLEAVLPDPQNFFQNALQDVAASAKIPSTILIGQQTGRLASNEDSRGFLSGMNGRRANYLTDMLKVLFNWCIEYGVLPSSEYDIVWSDLLALSNSEKLDNAREMSNVCREAYQSGLAPPFSEEEIRTAAGYDEELPHEGRLEDYLKDSQPDQEADDQQDNVGGVVN